MSDRQKIILVDDQLVNLTVGRSVLADNYEVFTVPSGEKLLMLLEKVKPDLILLDIEMPGMNGYDVIKALKDNPANANIPVVFLTAKSDAGSELEGLSLGAIDYISKPFSPPLLLKRIEVHLLVEAQKRQLQDYNDNLELMVQQKTETVLELRNAVLETAAELVEYRDDVTGGHIMRTQQYLRLLANRLIENGLYPEETVHWDTELMVLSGQLHDVGKITVSDTILCKPGKLTPEEFDIMKKHTTAGFEIIEHIQKRTTEQAFLNYAKVFAVSHHERWDGRGYPYGLSGTDIPLLGRLMSLADVYDALVSERPYKNPFTHAEATRIINEGRGSQFEPALVDIFLSLSEEFNRISYASLGLGSQSGN